MRRNFRFCLVLTIVGLGLLIVACGSHADADETSDWGGDAVVYFDALSAAYLANDFYGVLDFYVIDAFQARWRGSVRGGLPVRDLLVWNSGDLGHEVVDMYLGPDGALALIRWERPGGLSVVHSTIEHGRITSQTIFDHGAWLDAGLIVSGDIVSRYEDLYTGYANAVPRTEENGIGSTIPLASADVMTLMQEINSVEVDGLAVFLWPAGFGVDPERAVGIYSTTDQNECERQVAIMWELAEGQIVGEARYEEVSSYSDCEPDPPEGWWTDLELPAPSDEVTTGLIETPGGYQLEVHNGTPLLEELVLIGLDRFFVAGLDEPRFDAVTFEPSRQCEQRSGRLIQDETSRELFICFYETDLCPGSTVCEAASLDVRGLVLHELAHAWITDNVDTRTQQLLLDATGREVWQDVSVSWPERGVEYAAEVIAWGLLEENSPMVRIGRPSCLELTSSFEILTAVSPPRADVCG